MEWVGNLIGNRSAKWRDNRAEEVKWRNRAMLGMYDPNYQA